MELTKEQRDELQGLVDSLRKVPGNLCLIADGAFANHGEHDLPDALYLVAEFVKENVEEIAELFKLL